jgi:hypothetical protein
VALDIDTRFGVSTIIGKLGHGLGEVYRARDTLMATPALSNGVMYIRGAATLFAIGRK